MTRFVHVDRQPTFKTSLYYPAVFGGLWVTSRHFFVNLGRHLLQAIGVKGVKPGAYTVQYPEVMRPLPRVLRSKHRIKVHEDGRPKCTACMLCETACPDFCISITPAEHDGSPEEKAPAEFRIDLDRCCFCGFCVEACPKDAIYMDTQIMEISSDRRENFVLRLADLLDPQPIGCTGPEFAGKELSKVLPHLGYRRLEHLRPAAVDLEYRAETLARLQEGHAERTDFHPAPRR
jgi:NADH-quinone oxidoreductase subunit I